MTAKVAKHRTETEEGSGRTPEERLEDLRARVRAAEARVGELQAERGRARREVSAAEDRLRAYHEAVGRGDDDGRGGGGPPAGGARAGRAAGVRRPLGPHAAGRRWRVEAAEVQVREHARRSLRSLASERVERARATARLPRGGRGVDGRRGRGGSPSARGGPGSPATRGSRRASLTACRVGLPLALTSEARGDYRQRYSDETPAPRRLLHDGGEAA